MVFQRHSVSRSKGIKEFSKKIHSKPYGVNFPGAVWKFTVSDLSGTVRVTQGKE
jgi:hypothetical protein